ncbi:hypothetical protein DSO57_1020724 [Entomophthora muscae]|uniref:Uncharacterized protein n=1 Tax=Entomophthora muscae TaxID=34485 RepID=A0ACC2UEF1_9FUNG|nr:hypothetical protein DSO57_1020724 [Entomophthora muscae]
MAFVCLLYQLARPQFYHLARVNDRPDIFIDMAHPGYEAESPLPGVIIFRPQESLIFPNVDYIRSKVLDCVLEATTTTAIPDVSLWSEDLQLRGEKLRLERAQKMGMSPPNQDQIPLLRAIVFDLSSVNLIDSSGLQGLFDLRDMLMRYVGTSQDSDFEMDLTPAFEIHFVSTHPKVLHVLELSKITANSTLPPAIKNHLQKPSSDLGSNHFTLEPIVFNPSRYIHLSISDAIKRIQKNWDHQATLI